MPNKADNLLNKTKDNTNGIRQGGCGAEGRAGFTGIPADWGIGGAGRGESARTYCKGADAALNDRWAAIIKNIGGFEKMNINGIGSTGYPAWQGARKAESSTKGEFGANVKSTGNVVHIDPDAVFSIHHVKTGESANVYRRMIFQRTIRFTL